MPFLTILTHLGSALFLGSKAIGESYSMSKDRKKTALGEQFQAMYTDPKLEAELKAKVENPEYYDWVWERIEAYKRNRGKYYLWRHAADYWKAVGHKRPPFFSHGSYGSLYGKNERVSQQLGLNRAEALTMLMNTYGRMKEHGALYFTLMRNYEEMYEAVKQHPADAFIGDTTTALDEAPLEGVDMPDGWPEDRLPPNEVSKELKVI